MKTYGYCRVSTTNQTTDSQEREISSKYPDAEIYSEYESGSKENWDNREVLINLLGKLEKNDTLIISRLDRIGRSVSHVIDTINKLNDKGVTVISLHESLDSSSPTGRLMISLLASMSEFFLEVGRERVKEGIAAAKARGVHCGRSKIVSDEIRKQIWREFSEGEHKLAICAKFGISMPTVNKIIKEYCDGK